MSRPPLPIEIQDAKGAYIANPDRRPENPPEPEGDLPLEPPTYMRLTPKQKEIWFQIASRLAPGVGKSTDLDSFESLVRLKAKERSNRITAGERGQLIALYGRFAMTPSDRCKVSVAKKPASKLDRFLAKPKPAEKLPDSANILPA